MSTKSELKKNIGIFSALSTVMGTVIGGGVFFKTASVVSDTQSIGLTILVWIVSGLLTIFAGLTVSELAAAIPSTGGPINYLNYAYGNKVGYLMGWAQTLIYYPANIAALSLVFGTQIVNLFHLSVQWQMIIAILCGLSITLINLAGSKIGGIVQSGTLVVKLIPILVISIAGLFVPGEVNVQLFSVEPVNHVSIWTAFGNGLLATMFAYDGWIGISNIAGEMKNPKKDLPKAIVYGLAFVTIVYVLINFAFLKMLPISEIAGNQNTATEAAMKIFGDFGGKIVTIGILISVYGAINGYTLTGMRIPYSLAKNDSIPFSKQFAKLSKKTAIPYIAGIFQFIIALIMMIMGNFDILTDMAIFVMWIFFTLLFIEVFILRRKEPNLSRPYFVPGYPIIPLLAIIGSLFVLINTLIHQFSLSITGIIITLLGLPVYYIHQRKKK